jgi:hypothetical protein
MRSKIQDVQVDSSHSLNRVGIAPRESSGELESMLGEDAKGDAHALE